MSQGYEVVRPKPQHSGQPLMTILVVFLIIAGVFYFISSEEHGSKVIIEPTTAKAVKENSASLQKLSLDQLDAEHEKLIDDLEERHKEALNASQATALRLESDVSELMDEVRKLTNEIEVKDNRRDIMAEQITALMSKIPAAIVVNEKQILQLKKVQVIDKAPTETQPELEVIITDYKLISSSPPAYPRRAEDRARAGFAVVKYTITTSGSVSNLEIIDERPTGWGFGRATLNAAAKLKYLPSSSDGSPVETNGVTKRYSFNME